MQSSARLRIVLAKPEFRTPDVGGKATTEIVGKAIAERLGT